MSDRVVIMAKNPGRCWPNSVTLCHPRKPGHGVPGDRRQIYAPSPAAPASKPRPRPGVAQAAQARLNALAGLVEVGRDGGPADLPRLGAVSRSSWTTCCRSSRRASWSASARCRRAT
jgi:hypothetical protein